MIIHVNKLENSPYQSINEHISNTEKYAQETTRLLLNMVCSILGLSMLKAHSSPLKFKGRIVYNPETSKPITVADWKKLEDAIVQFLHIERDQIQKKIVHEAMWLGRVLQRMKDNEKRSTTPISKIKLNGNFVPLLKEDWQKNTVTFAERLAGTYLQQVTDKAKNKIQTIITEGERQGKSKHRVFSDLWDQEEDINRDWNRVVNTETAMNANNGYMMTLLGSSEEEHIFMKGVSAPDACKKCKELIADKIVVLLTQPPRNGKDEVIIDGKNYTAIWPGKSNYGLKASQYRTATIIHPHDRCTWVEWYLELDKYFPQGV
jgi:hypothetical protein